MFEWLLSLFRKERTIEDQILYALKRLGRTPNAIARSLAKKGIKGRGTCSSACPIAQYLKTVLPPGIFLVFTAWYCITLYRTGGGVSKLDTPVAVRLFMQRFDSGRYYSNLREVI